MQVDSSNFDKLLPEILHHIEHAHFLAFDCQFTGLVTQSQSIEGCFPNHVQFYERIKQTACNFRLLQVGLAAFIYEGQVYTPKVYNFFINPMTFTQGYNNILVCEVESMEFLAKNEMDFRRVFRYGIKSKRLYAQEALHKQTQHKLPMMLAENMFLCPEEADLAQLIDEKIAAALKGHPKQEIFVNFKNKTIFSFFKRKYANFMFDKPKKNMSQFEYAIRVLEFKNRDQEKIIEQKNDEVLSPAAQTFQIVLKAMIHHRKPLVGHFPSLDIGLIYHSFLADLPETYEQFCYQLNSIFPFIFDTKILSRRLQHKLKGLKVDLSSLYKACSNPKLLQPYSNFNFEQIKVYIQKEQSHEAGYDAFMTGCAFVGMANYLAGQKGKLKLEVLEGENKLFYSRFGGQVSLRGDGYCSGALDYENTILIQTTQKALYPQWREVAKILSKFGSLVVQEDHQEIYYVFEKSQNILGIIATYPGFNLRNYSQRRIIKARQIYTPGHT